MGVRRTAAAMIGLALTAALAGCGGDDGASGASGDTLRIGGNTNATVLPLWVAQSEGFFEDHGLKVEYTQVQNVATLPPALDKTFDIVLSTPTLVASSNVQGIPVRWVAGSSYDTTEKPGSFVEVSKDSGITDISQLEGKKIGVLNESGTLHIATLNWLKKSGVDLDSIEVVQVDGPAQADQLAAGRVDAVETVSPFSSAIEAKGGVSLGVPYRSMADSVAPIIWAASQSWAKGHDKELEAFKAALDEGAEFIEQHPDEAREILKKEAKYDDAIAKAVTYPEFDTGGKPEDIQIWLDVMQDVLGFDSSKVDASDLLYQP